MHTKNQKVIEKANLTPIYMFKTQLKKKFREIKQNK